MRKKTIGLILILLITLTVPLTYARPPSGARGRSNKASLLLVKKNYNWDPIWPGPFGQLKYKLEADEFSPRLIVNGLEPEKWYLVTIDAPFKDGENPFEGSDGIFGVKEYDTSAGKHGFMDIALFKTNEYGDANVILPTTSGLTASDLNLSDLGSGKLAEGTYTGAKIAVKYVGSNADGTIPEIGLLLSGGYNVGGKPDARDYNLYETALMETFEII